MHTQTKKEKQWSRNTKLKIENIYLLPYRIVNNTFGYWNFKLSFEILVSWKLTTVPIFFGYDIQLKCTAKGSEDCFGSRIFKWIGGPEKEVISFDVQVYDHRKYKVFHERGHYWLVIKNSTARDIDIPYICHCGFYYSESILKNVSLIHSDVKGMWNFILHFVFFL